MKNNKKTLKKFFSYIAITIAGLICLCLILYCVLFLIKQSHKNDIVSSGNDYQSKNFRTYFPADFDVDLSKDKEYLKLDSLIHYTYPDGQTFAIQQLDKSVLNEGQRFFVKYFDIATYGKSNEYSSLFTKEYQKNPKGFEKDPYRIFAPQRIYDISVRELARTEKSDTSFTYDGNPCVFGFYIVDFKILKNDGLFRRDIEENASRPLIFELVTFDAGTQNETTYIKNLYTPDSVSAD